MHATGHFENSEPEWLELLERQVTSARVKLIDKTGNKTVLFSKDSEISEEARMRLCKCFAPYKSDCGSHPAFKSFDKSTQFTATISRC